MRIIRFLSVPFAILLFATCSSAPVTRSETPASSVSHAPNSEPQKTSVDAVVEFLLTSAATDFHAHPSPAPVRFRNVRIGHVMLPSGHERYLLCGQFLPAQEAGKAEWIPFTTIKTSGYEQWTGAQAASYCSSVIWDSQRDLSSSLRNHLDSLR